MSNDVAGLRERIERGGRLYGSLAISQRKVAEQLGFTPQRLNAILRRHRVLSPEMARRIDAAITSILQQQTAS